MSEFETDAEFVIDLMPSKCQIDIALCQWIADRPGPNEVHERIAMNPKSILRLGALLGVGALFAFALISLGVSPVLTLAMGVILLFFQKSLVKIAALTVLAAIEKPWFGQKTAQKLTLAAARIFGKQNNTTLRDNRSSQERTSEDFTMKSPRDFRDELAQGVANNTLGSMLPHQDNQFVPWLLEQSSDDVYVAFRCGFNQDISDIEQVVHHQKCDRATALLIYSQHFQIAWFDQPDVLDKGFSARVLKQPLSFDQHFIPVVVGQNYASGFYPDSGLMQNLERFYSKYRKAWDAASEVDLPGWFIDPEEFASRSGREADSPFLFGDLHAVYRSKEVEREMLANAKT